MTTPPSTSTPGSLTTRTLLASVLLVSILGLTFWALIASLNGFREAADQQDRAQQVIAVANRTERSLLSLQTGVRGFVITGSDRFLEPWRRARRQFPEDVAKLAALVRDQPEQTRRVRAIARAGAAYDRGWTEPLIAARRRSFATARDLTKTRIGKEQVDALSAQFAELVAAEELLVQGRARRTAAAAQAAERRAIGGMLATVLLLLGFAAYLRKRVLHPVRELSEATERLAGGELGARVTPMGAGELTDLGRSFNSMTDSLEEGRLALETQNAALAEARAQAEDAQTEAERANQAKSEFVSRMSHELRTPLNAVLGFGQLLEMDELAPRQAESVKHILRGGRHLLELINEVLDLSRIEAGVLTISLEPVRIGDAVADALSLVRPLAEAQGIQLRGEVTDLHDCYVMADRQRLKQVLLNLLSNAIKYNREHGAVTVGVADVAAGMRISVKDEGAGIPADRLDRLFKPFDRLGAEQTTVEGTGLGLALSRRLVEAMCGQIGVQNEPGRTTFYVDLAKTDAPAHSEIAASSAPDASAPAADARRASIVYVEDNISNLRLVEQILEVRPGIRLLPAMQGAIAVDLVRRHKPDLVLLDLHLPDMPGSAVLERLKRDPATTAIPVVVLSADATPQQVRSLLAAGAVEYLTKPIEVKRFLEVVEELLDAERPAPV